MPADGEPVFEVFVMRNSPAVLVLTVQVPPEPRLDEPAKVDELALKPDAGVQAPLAVVQAAKPTDFIVVDEPAVNVKL
jgi:hypothetical protein